MADKGVSCKYNQECWLKVRLPIIKKNKDIYLPYQCSYVEMGDLENCGIRDKFIEREQGVKEEYAGLSTEGVVTGDIQG